MRACRISREVTIMYDFDTQYVRPPREKLGSQKWMAARKAGCPPDAVPLSVADMEFATAPEIIQSVRDVAEFGLWGYTAADDGYRRAVTGWMRSRHGWNAKPDWLVLTPGVVNAIYTAVQAFTEPGDGVIVQPPVYPPFFKAVQDNGRRLLENPLLEQEGHYQINFEELERLAPDASLLLLCSPHNPVGRVWTREELLRLAEICRKNDVMVFSDEIHCDIVRPEFSHIPWGNLGEEYQQNSIIGTAASKTFSLAGLSTSNIFIQNDALRQRFERQMVKNGNEFNSAFGMIATRTAYISGEPWLRELLAYLSDNYELIEKYIQEKMPILKLAPLEGSYLAWIDCRALGMDGEALDHFMRTKAKLFVNNGKMFGMGGEGFIRLNFACPQKVLRQALEGLAKALAEDDYL